MLAPGVRDVVVTLTQTGEGVPEGGKVLRCRLADRSLDARMFFPCANPACKKGGFLLRPKLMALIEGGQARGRVALACAGYLGSVRSTLHDQPGAPPRCANRLEAEIEIVRA